MSKKETLVPNIAAPTLEQYLMMLGPKLFTTPEEILDKPVGEIFSAPIKAPGYVCLEKLDGSFHIDMTRAGLMNQGILYKVLYKGPTRGLIFRSAVGEHSIDNSKIPFTVVQHWRVGGGGRYSKAAMNLPIAMADVNPNLIPILTEIMSAPYEIK